MKIRFRFKGIIFEKSVGDFLQKIILFVHFQDLLCHPIKFWRVIKDFKKTLQ